VQDDDTPETLAARILEEEHRVYPAAIQRVLDGRWKLAGRRFLGDAARSEF
jgi:phosphoribosylglycinamide formyltransferase-1